MNELCVVHLVRKKNGPEPFKRFIDSYVANPAGMEHDLLIVFKGFGRDQPAIEYDQILQGIPHKRYFVRDFGFDIGPYLKVAKALEYRHFCFLNSFSQILAADWLRKMSYWATQSGVGVVGATGSYQSLRSDFVDFWLVERADTLANRLRYMKRFVRYYISVRDSFPAFPNYHIRTNAFMVARDTLAGLRFGTILLKWDAYCFESSKNGLTWRSMNLGLSPMVVDKSGNGYEKERWQQSETFWCKNQQNLLIADNQTSVYANGDKKLRARLSFHAWRCWPDGTRRHDFPES